MSTTAETKDVEDTVSRVDGELAVGANLEFQRKWWRFESAVWAFFTLLLLMDLLGFFGRGYFARVQMHTPGGSMKIHYERVERFSTPSILTVLFEPSAIHDGKVQLWVSESLVKQLGAQRIVPQPTASVLGGGGILYTFEATAPPASVEFALQPAEVGFSRLQLKVPGQDTADLQIFVMP